MKIETFELERVQSLWENLVEINLTESGIHPYTLEELLDPGEIAELSRVRLGYGQTNGSIEFRGAISALYDGADIDNILVTNGSAEANFVASWSLLEAGDEMVMMLPNYMQLWGIAASFGVDVRPFHLRLEHRWVPDLDELRAAVSPNTKMIAVCNPNNPTGAVLDSAAMQEIVRVAAEVDAWLYCDEVYKGTELDGNEALSQFAETLEHVCVDTVEQGDMTKDLALLVGPDQRWLTTNQFLDKLDTGLQAALS